MIIALKNHIGANCLCVQLRSITQARHWDGEFTLLTTGHLADFWELSLRANTSSTLPWNNVAITLFFLFLARNSPLFHTLSSLCYFLSRSPFLFTLLLFPHYFFHSPLYSSLSTFLSDTFLVFFSRCLTVSLLFIYFSLIG